MDQDAVRARGVIGLGAPQGLAEAPAGDEGLDARDDAEVVVALRVLAGLDAAAELVDVGERLLIAVDEAVGLREELVLDAHRRDAALLELAHQAAHVVEVAVAGVAVEQDRDRRDVRHELEHLQHLRPGGLVAVAHAVLRRDGEAACPQPLEAGLLADARADAVVGLQQELQLRTLQQLAEPRGLLRAHTR